MGKLFDMCRMGCWSFSSWFDVNRFTRTNICSKYRLFLGFRSQWPWPLTFRPQICSPCYSCPALCFH